MTVSIRTLRRDDDNEIALVAERMELTLIEVLGHERGSTMYSRAWLHDRVRWHLDPEMCTGEIFVAEHDGEIVGHTIVRIEVAADDRRTGLFSTIYVTPNARRAGVADALVVAGQSWFASHSISVTGTNTSETNTPLIVLFEKHGYVITIRAAENRMVHLSKTAVGSGN